MAAVLAGSHWDPRTKRFSGAAAGLHSAATMLELIDPWQGAPQLVVIRERMPITTWARTLLDLATVLLGITASVHCVRRSRPAITSTRRRPAASSRTCSCSSCARPCRP